MTHVHAVSIYIYMYVTHIHAVSEDAEVFEWLQPDGYRVYVDEQPAKDHHERPDERRQYRADRMDSRRRTEDERDGRAGQTRQDRVEQVERERPPEEGAQTWRQDV